MKIVKVKQGTPEWHAHRARYFNASDAPAMMGCSPYKTRDQLVRELATGLSEEITPQKAAIFEAGHRAEALARPLAERIVGEELFPVTAVADEGPYSASMDGLSMGEDKNFEHKALNDVLREAMFPGCTGADLPLLYRVQMEHQNLVGESIERTLFMASKWDQAGNLIEERHCWYTPDPALRAAIVEGWKKLELDVAAYAPDQQAPAPKLDPKDKQAKLPAIRIEVRGEVVASNVEDLRALAVGRIALVKTELATDQDFLDAKVDADWLREVAASMKMGLQMVRAGMEPVDAVMTMMEQVEALATRKAIDLEKQVETEGKRRKDAVVDTAQVELNQHIQKHNDALGANYLQRVVGPLAMAAKGLKTIKSTEEKVGAALVAEKAKADALALAFTRNRAVLKVDGTDWISLFPDFATMGSSEPEVFQAIAKQRIEKAKEAAEAAKAQPPTAPPEAMKCDGDHGGPISGTPVPPDGSHLAATRPMLGLDLFQESQASNVVSMRTAPAIAPVSAERGVPTLRIGVIKERLQHMTVTAEDLRALGFEPAGRERAAPLYHDDDFPAICDAIAVQAMAAKAAYLQNRATAAA